jgi:hypothetical protein
MYLYRVLPESLDDTWNYAWSLLRKAHMHSYGEQAEEDYLQQIIEGYQQLWMIIEDDKPKAAVVTEIAEYPRKTVCRIVMMSGEDIDMLTKALPELEFWAESKGARVLEAWTRPSIARFARKHGFTCEKHVIAKFIGGLH